MATHGRTGIDLERYHARKLRPHKVPGMYVTDGSQAKPTRMTLDEFLVASRRRGSGSGKRKPSGDGTKAPKAASTVTHYYPLRATGRPNASEMARLDRRAKLREMRKHVTVTP